MRGWIVLIVVCSCSDETASGEGSGGAKSTGAGTSVGASGSGGGTRDGGHDADPDGNQPPPTSLWTMAGVWVYDPKTFPRLGVRLRAAGESLRLGRAPDRRRHDGEMALLGLALRPGHGRGLHRVVEALRAFRGRLGREP